MTRSASLRDLCSGADPVLENLIEEFARSVGAGEAVEVEEYVRHYPEHAERLRKTLPALQALGELNRSLSAAPAVGEVPGVGAAEAPVTGILGDFRILCEVGR